MILFTRAPEADLAEVQAAVEDGRISAERFEDAVLRVLALKAALGLHDTAICPAARGDRARLGQGHCRRGAAAGADPGQGHPEAAADQPGSGTSACW